MPLVISPGAVNPPPVVSATSPDGILTVTADPEHAGALLEADFAFGSVQNVDEFTGDITGWAAYTVGGTSTVVYDAGLGGRLKVTATSAAGSAGAAWTLPTPIPAGRVRLVFDWTCTAGLAADRVQISFNSVSGAALHVRPFPARGGLGGTRWTVEADTAEPVAKVYIYANANVANGTVLHLDNVTAGSAMPERVRFTRHPDVSVRSGDPAIAFGGLAVAYDHEAPLGVAASWTATPVWRDGTEGTVAQGVALVIPAPSEADGFEGWLKSIENPNLSMPVKIHNDPAFPQTSRVSLQPVPGGGMAGSWDRRLRGAQQYVFHIDTLAERDALDVLLDSGPLLMQVNPVAGIRDFYCVALDSDESYSVGGYDPRREVTVSLQPIDRIPTIDSPLYIPGHSYDDSTAVAAIYDLWSVLYPTYQDTWRGAMPEPEAIPPETGGGGNEGVI